MSKNILSPKFCSWSEKKNFQTEFRSVKALGPKKVVSKKNGGSNKWVQKLSYCTLLIWITLYPLTIGRPVCCDYGSPFSLLLPSWPSTTRAVWWVVGSGEWVVAV